MLRQLAAIAAGGAVGALCRYGLGVAAPTGPRDFPWATFLINVTGCLLIGVLIVLVTEGFPGAHPLLRPFLATGVLGGYTTFSTYAVDVIRLTDKRAAGTALAYLLGTLAAALIATYLGVLGARLLLRYTRRRLA